MTTMMRRILDSLLSSEIVLLAFRADFWACHSFWGFKVKMRGKGILYAFWFLAFLWGFPDVVLFDMNVSDSLCSAQSESSTFSSQTSHHHFSTQIGLAVYVTRTSTSNICSNWVPSSNSLTTSSQKKCSQKIFSIVLVMWFIVWRNLWIINHWIIT